MKKTIQLIAMATLCLFLSGAYAQTQALKVGDRMPEVTIKNIFGASDARQKISDFNGKLTLLYFWATNCRSSTDLLTDMAELEQEYAGKLTIISVGKGEEETLKKIAVEHSLTKRNFIKEDSLLTSLFPHYLYPEIVWIGPDQKILGITTRQDVNTNTINKILNGETYAFSSPKADLMGFDSSNPLFSPTEGYSMKPLFHSVLSSYGDGLPAGMGISKTSGPVRIHAINQTRLALYVLALKLPGYYWPLNRIVYQNVNPEKFRIGSSPEERREKSYCYELILPEFFRDRIHSYMLDDLERLFGVTARIEKKMITAYVLSAIPGKLNTITKGGVRSNNFSKTGAERKYMTNSTVFALTEYLESISGGIPVVDETNYTGRADLTFRGDHKDILSVNTSLAPYGLRVQKAERAIDILVFSPAVLANSHASQPINLN